MPQQFLKPILILCVALFALQARGQFYQGSYQEFGKNRVQYKDFLWQQYRFKEFDTYFYEGGQQLAEFTSKVAQKNIRSLEDVFDYTVRDKIEFIVYNSHSDFKQSNIGISNEPNGNIGGTTQIVGSKVFIYFEGDYVKFEQNLRRGIATVLINNRLYGGNWRDVIKSSTLLNLPDWYTEGLILYASQSLDDDAANIIRSDVMNGTYEKLNRLEGRRAAFAGYALWSYVAEMYGENILPNILYMSGVSRNVESGFLFVLGKSLDTITKEFVAYYRGEYGSMSLDKKPISQNKLPIKTKKDRVYTSYKISPDGRYAIYVSNILGQYRLYLYDTVKQKRKKILKAEHKLMRIPDYSFPVLAWHPSSNAFTYAKEWRGKLMLCTYSLETGKTTEREVFVLDEILSMQYSPNGQQLILSAVDQGQTDLYLYYTIGNRQERLTNDIYGDFDPSFSKDGSRIIFTSNRTDDTLRTNPKPLVLNQNRDVFAFNLKSRSPFLERITDTPNLIERDPYQYEGREFTFLADYKGTVNRYVATYDSTVSRIDTTIHYRYYTVAEPLTNYGTDILDYTVHSSTGEYSFYTYKENGYQFYYGNVANDKAVSRSEDGLTEQGEINEDGFSRIRDLDELEKAELTFIPKQESDDEDKIDIANYRFEGEPDYTYERETITLTELPSEKEEYRPAEQGYTALDSLSLPGARNYNLNFTTDKLLAQLDNTFMTEFYQPLSNPDGLNPGLGVLTQLAVSDLFEDYKIVGGFGLSGNLDNNTFMLMAEDLTRRTDRRLQLFRQQSRISPNGFSLAENVTYQAAYRLSYPLNEVFSLRGSGMYRYDELITLATDQFNAGRPSEISNYAGLKGEVVFDNTLPMGLNLRRGMRWKVWGEYYMDPTNTDRTFMTFGLDFRNYYKIHRNLILASRLGWSTSLGAERLAFFLGSVDNVLNPREDNSLPLDPEQNYQFMTRGAPMRGFFANARNGNSFAVINNELRWPIFSYFYQKPLKSDFLENFQVLGFFDVGSAWTGPTPYSAENSFNNTIIESGNVTLEIENNRDPVVYGYGFGLRSKLLGYFVRVDWAWGVDDGITLDRVFYISLAMDF
jgi:Tol biopolymer transport system component